MFENAEKNACQCRIMAYVYSCIPDQIILVTTKILYVECIVSKASREWRMEEKKGKK